MIIDARMMAATIVPRLVIPAAFTAILSLRYYWHAARWHKSRIDAVSDISCFPALHYSRRRMASLPR